MEQLKHITGKLNLDVAKDVLPPEDYYDALNIVQGRAALGEAGFIKNIIGNTVADTLPTGTACIGLVESDRTAEFYAFLYHATPANQAIYKVVAGTASLVIQSDKLNFESTDIIVDCEVIDNILYYTDKRNEVRAISLTEWTGGSGNATEEDISLIKAPPLFSPDGEKVAGLSTDPDLIGNYDFQFAYQYVYETNQRSVLSPYSTVVLRNLDDQTDRRIDVYLPVNADTIGDATFDVTEGGVEDEWTLNSHGLKVGNRVKFTAVGTGAEPYAVDTDYWVVNIPDSDTFQLSATKGGSVLEGTGTDSSGTWTLLYSVDTSVKVKMLIADIENISDTDPLPLNADLEKSVIDIVLKEFLPTQPEQDEIKPVVNEDSNAR